jgi:TatD DNase family protein
MTDSHTHLNLPPLLDSVDSYLASAKNAGVDRMMVVGTDVASSLKAINLAKKYPQLWASVGVHPDEARPGQLGEVTRQLEELIAGGQVSAIGECGLDYSGDGDHDAQKLLFQVHIELAVEHRLPLIIHCRNTRRADDVVVWNAYEDLLEQLKRQRNLPQFILHCVSGPVPYVQEALKLGAYVSFAGNVTYPSAGAIREILRIVPMERVLVETDAPFLAPQHHRGATNEPAFVDETARFISTFLNVPFDELDLAVTENARSLFEH